MKQKEAKTTVIKAAKHNTRSMVLAALFAALLAVLSQITIPMVPVPINLALLAVYLCAMVLKPRWAIISVGLYLLMGALGLPVFSGFRGGPSSLFGITGGYLWGYVLTAAAIASLRPLADSFIKSVLILFVGLLCCYIPGTLWLMMLTGRGWAQALTLAVYPFLPGDAIKIVMASALAPRISQTLKRV